MLIRTALALTVMASLLVSLVPVANASSSSSSMPSVPPAMEWEANYGGMSGLKGSQMIQTSDGGYAIAGNVVVHSYIHSQPPYVWLVKADAAGNMEWNQIYDHLYDVAGLVQTSDGSYVIVGDSYTTKEDLLSTGNTYPAGIRLFKTDLNGSVQGSRTYKYWSGGASSMAQTNDGGYIIAGSLDKGGFLIKTDASGRTQWNGTYGEPDNDNRFSSVIQTGDGYYAAAGNTQFNDTNAFWLVKTDANGNAVWSQTYGSGDSEAKSVVQTADGGYALAGNTGTYGAGASDAWLVKTDPHGNMLWNRTYGGAGLVTLHSGAGDVVVGSNGNGYDYAYSLIQTSDGDLALAGKTLMPNNYALAWLVKLDAVGNAEWNHTYPNRQMGGEGWIAYHLIETSDGGFALAGSWDLTGSVHYYCLVKTEPALPPPIPTPTPLDTSSTQSNFIEVTVIAIVAVVVVVVVTGSIFYFKKRKR